MVKIGGGVNVFVPTDFESGFKLSPAFLKPYITSQKKLLFFHSPSNPTGVVYSKDELKAIAQVVAATPNFYVISDEIYEHINFVGKNESFAQFPEVYSRTITVNGVAKAFAMTGWRVGYIGAPKEIAAACTKLQGQYTSGTGSISQRATKAAMEADPKEIKFMVDAFHKRRDLCVARLREIK